MYKIYIKSAHSTKPWFMPYMIDVTDSTTRLSTPKEYSTDDLTELAETYQKLLKVYTTDQLRVVEELKPDLVVNIIDDCTLGNLTAI